MMRNGGILAVGVGLLQLVACAPTSGGDEAIGSMRTFGASGKELKVLEGGREAELLHHEGSGCLTHMWFGGDWPGYDRTRIRCYVDGEAEPSIDMEMFLGHGVGFGDDAAPWGTARFGKTGHPSGVYNNNRIPFDKSVRVTAQLGEGVDTNPPFWWIIRGVENMPVTIGGLRLPDGARLRLYRTEKHRAEPLELIDLCDTRTAGMLYQVTMSVRSENLNFLEACLRAYVDGGAEPLLLSSGTEDYFLGTYYFNRGSYHFPEAGLTHMDRKANTFSAYRFHEQDPIIFSKGLRLVWRNGEAREDGKKFGNPKPSTLTAYAWLYEWDAQDQ